MTAAITCLFLAVTVAFVMWRNEVICWESQRLTLRAMYKTALQQLDALDFDGYSERLHACQLFWEARK